MCLCVHVYMYIEMPGLVKGSMGTRAVAVVFGFRKNPPLPHDVDAGSVPAEAPRCHIAPLGFLGNGLWAHGFSFAGARVTDVALELQRSNQVSGRFVSASAIVSST